jgi:hypothetical protein
MLLELAQTGNHSAMREIAEEIGDRDEADVTPKEAKLSVRYLTELAKTDDEAMLRLGTIYYTGRRGVKQSYAKAFRCYRKAAENSLLQNHWALNNLGYCYYYGRATGVDYKKAYMNFARAAYLGNPNSMFKLGDMYYNGYHVKRDPEAAFYWYNLADGSDDKNHYTAASVAQRLGRAYLNGEGTKCEPILALNWLRQAEILFFLLALEREPFVKNLLTETQELLQSARSQLDELISDVEAQKEPVADKTSHENQKGAEKEVKKESVYFDGIVNWPAVIPYDAKAARKRERANAIKGLPKGKTVTWMED